MIWFFQRPGDRLGCEIRRATYGQGYELVWTSDDGRTRVEVSQDSEELIVRLRMLEQWLKLDGWVRSDRVTPPRTTRPESKWRQRNGASSRPEVH